jgi:hypothetical protein
MNDYKVELKLEDGVLHVRLSGQFPYEKLNQPENAYKGLIDACATHQCDRLLIDSRDLQARFSTTQLYRAGKDAVSLTIAGIEVAMVTRQELRDTFFDDVVVNRGGQVRIFTDINDARDWIQKYPTHQPNQSPRASLAEPAGVQLAAAAA